MEASQTTPPRRPIATITLLSFWAYNPVTWFCSIEVQFLVKGGREAGD
jgi:hypothetical protein